MTGGKEMKQKPFAKRTLITIISGFVSFAIIGALLPFPVNISEFALLTLVGYTIIWSWMLLWRLQNQTLEEHSLQKDSKKLEKINTWFSDAEPYFQEFGELTDDLFLKLKKILNEDSRIQN